MLIAEKKVITKKSKNNFFISSDVELVEKLNDTDNLFKKWKIKVSSFNDSFVSLKNKLNII